MHLRPPLPCLRGGCASLLQEGGGTAVAAFTVGIVKEVAFDISAAAFQRRMGRIWTVDGNMGVPKEAVDRGRNCLVFGIGSQDDTFTGCSGGGRDTFTRTWDK